MHLRTANNFVAKMVSRRQREKTYQKCRQHFAIAGWHWNALSWNDNKNMPVINLPNNRMTTLVNVAEFSYVVVKCPSKCAPIATTVTQTKAMTVIIFVLLLKFVWSKSCHHFKTFCWLLSIHYSYGALTRFKWGDARVQLEPSDNQLNAERVSFLKKKKISSLCWFKFLQQKWVVTLASKLITLLCHVSVS